MIEMQNAGSLFDLPQHEHEAAAITTNGVIGTTGHAIMGKGQALEAAKRYSGLSAKLGEYLQRYGNRAFYIGRFQGGGVVTFPTKHHYRDKSDINLIAISAQQVKQIADRFKLTKIYLPPVGCGLGRLDYESQVRPILQKYLDDDRFVVVLGYKDF